MDKDVLENIYNSDLLVVVNASILLLCAGVSKTNSKRKRKGAWENKGLERLKGGLPGLAHKTCINSPF